MMRTVLICVVSLLAIGSLEAQTHTPRALEPNL
jgi:hypothetical protein